MAELLAQSLFDARFHNTTVKLKHETLFSIAGLRVDERIIAPGSQVMFLINVYSFLVRSLLQFFSIGVCHAQQNQT